LTATTSSDTVFDAKWLQPGMHLGTISSDYEMKVLNKSNVVVVNTRPFGGFDLVHDFVMGGADRSLTVGRRKTVGRTGLTGGRRSSLEIC